MFVMKDFCSQLITLKHIHQEGYIQKTRLTNKYPSFNNHKINTTLKNLTNAIYGCRKTICYICRQHGQLQIHKIIHNVMFFCKYLKESKDTFNLGDGGYEKQICLQSWLKFFLSLTWVAKREKHLVPEKTIVPPPSPTHI